MLGLIAERVGNSSWAVRGFPSSNTVLGYHLPANEIKLMSMGIVSFPMFVSLHLTSFGLRWMITGWIMPFSCSSLSRRVSTLGVSPGRERRIWLNLSILRNAMSLRMSRVHFFPKTPRLVLIGQFLNATVGSRGSSWVWLFMALHYTFGSCPVYLV